MSTKIATMKTNPPTTAAEARAIAVRLEQAERETAARKSEARKKAEWDACADVLAHADGPLNDARDQAAAEWTAARSADVLDLARLFTAWVQLRRATAARAATVASCNTAMNNLRPKRHDTSGQHIDHRHDTHDGYAQTAWADVLDQVIRDHVERHTAAAIDAASSTIRQAGATAADAA